MDFTDFVISDFYIRRILVFWVFPVSKSRSNAYSLIMGWTDVFLGDYFLWEIRIQLYLPNNVSAGDQEGERVVNERT